MPRGVAMRLGTIRYRVRGYPRALAFMPDGKTVVARSENSSVQFFDVATGRRLKELRPDDMLILSHAITPDGKRIIAAGAIREDEKQASRGALRIWDANTLKEIRTIRWPGDEVPTQVFLAAGGKVAVTPDRTAARLWDLEGNEALPSHPFPQSQAFAVSLDGTTIAIADRNGRCDIWEWKTSKSRSMAIGTRDIESLDFSPDGKTLAVGVDYTDGMLLLDVASGKRRHALSYQRTHGARQAAFTSDNKYVIVADQRGLKERDGSGWLLFFDIESGKLAREMRCPGRGISAPVLSPDGKRLAAVSDSRIRVWDTTTWKEASCDDDAHRAMVQGIAVTSDGQVVTVSYDGTTQTREMKNGRLLSQSSFHHRLRIAATAPDGKRLALFGDDDEFTILDLAGGNKSMRLPGHGRFGGDAVAFTSDGKRLLSFGSDYFLRATDVITGKAAVDFPVQPQGVDLPDDEKGRPRNEFAELGGPAAFAPNGRHFVWNIRNTIRVFDVETGKENLRMSNPGQTVTSLAISSDGSHLLSTARARPVRRMLPNGETRFVIEHTHVSVWKIENGESVFSTQISEPIAGGATFSPEGKLVAVVVPGLKPRILLLAANDGKMLQEIDLPSPPGWKLAFTPDGKQIGCAMTDSTVLFFDISQRKR